MLWTLVCTALAGDLDGWAGQPWGSTVGGPKDPTAATVFPPGRGEMAYVVAMRPIDGVLPAQTFFGAPTLSPVAWYVEGGLGQVSFSVPADRTDALLAALTTAMGEPYKESGTRHFQTGTVSVSLMPYPAYTLVQLVSATHRARCVVLFASGCQLAKVRDEYSGQSNALLDEQRLAQDQLAAERMKQAQEQAAQIQALTGALSAPAPIRKADTDRAIVERDAKNLHNELRLCLVSTPMSCAPTKARVLEFWVAHPEIRPATDADCTGRGLPAKCWKW